MKKRLFRFDRQAKKCPDRGSGVHRFLLCVPDLLLARVGFLLLSQVFLRAYLLY